MTLGRRYNCYFLISPYIAVSPTYREYSYNLQYYLGNIKVITNGGQWKEVEDCINAWQIKIETHYILIQFSDCAGAEMSMAQLVPRSVILGVARDN